MGIVVNSMVSNYRDIYYLPIKNSNTVKHPNALHLFTYEHRKDILFY